MIDWSQKKAGTDMAREAAAQQLAIQIAEARRYLAETDWYVTRMAETGQPVPAGVTARRATARTRIAPAGTAA